MAIFGRFGDPLTVVRVASLDDVRPLSGRKPDKQDRSAIESGSYLVCRDEDGKELLYHQAFMRADGGSREIAAAIEALGAAETA